MHCNDTSDPHYWSLI